MQSFETSSRVGGKNSGKAQHPDLQSGRTDNKELNDFIFASKMAQRVKKLG
jgi:hypothetical protein